MAPSIFLCAGTANVSVQIGEIMPFHLLPSSFRGGNGISQAEYRKSAGSRQESHPSLSWVHIVRQLLKELAGTHVPAKSAVESGYDLA